MIDAILYVKQFDQFVTQLNEHHPEMLERDEDGSIAQPPSLTGFAHTPPTVNGNSTLIYARLTDEQAQQWRDMPHAEVLAEVPYTGTGTADRVYQQLQDDAESWARYTSVYDPAPREIDDGEGGTVTYTPPLKFGMLAESTLPVPESVTSRQGMEQLIRLGLDEQVDAAIDAIEDVVQRKIVRNWLDKAGVWERHNPQFVALSAQLGLTPEQSDQYMREASLL